MARRRGELEPIRSKDPEVRLWSYVGKDGPVSDWRPELGPCWPWKGTIRRQGYGQIYFHGRLHQAHRLVYEREIGPIPEGLELDHLCRNRACVRPAHLEPVTGGENLRRGFGASGINGRKTHCPKGHEYTRENTLVTADGSRKCRQCAHDTSADRAAAAKRARSETTRTETCAMCDTVFTFAGNRPKKYCSDKCRAAAAAEATARYRSRLSKERDTLGT